MQKNQNFFSVKKQSSGKPRLRNLRAGWRGLASGFTLVEILVVISIISLLAALGFGAMSRVREAARQTKCETNLKALVIALDAFKQERGHYPVYLQELVDRKYIADTSLLHCPDDPEPESDGYGDFYVQRSMRNDQRYSSLLPGTGEVPTIVCPFHEESGHGFQAFSGMQTHNFTTQPAVLVNANSTTIQRPGQRITNGVDGMKLQGADRIRCSGSALIRFADGSTCELRTGSDVTVLQSFVMGSESTLYTLVRQALGDVIYSVHHGSKFDVSTPTATAGALGTEFRITVTGNYSGNQNEIPRNYQETWTDTSQSPTSRVACGTPAHNTVIPRNVPINVAVDMLSRAARPAKHETKRGKNYSNPGTTGTPVPNKTPGPSDGSDN